MPRDADIDRALDDLAAKLGAATLRQAEHRGRMQDAIDEKHRIMLEVVDLGRQNKELERRTKRWLLDHGMSQADVDRAGVSAESIRQLTRGHRAKR